MPNASAVVKQRKPVAVLYGASTSQTRVIAERVAERLRACEFPAHVHSVWGLEQFDLAHCSGVVLAAPVRQGQHEQAVVDFVKTHRAELDRLPVAFISATIEAAAQPPPDARERPGQFEGDVQMAPNPFFAETGWHPTRVKSFAGAISYTQYNFFVRIVLKLLAPRGGAGTDTGRDRPEVTWDALDVFVNEFVREIQEAESLSAGK
jgi:menaquinone-dependent protoporphyrinogen oxidase